ncbi:MAG TPA: hypothetical protein VFW05_07370 [Verrucomicrobiae bacterium]|jgi:hypothetical protein|nr:hypothetical protein [Verrucomicrobiae bacterium]
MKVKPSQKPGHVIVDLAAPDVALLANTKSESTEAAVTVVEAENTFREELIQRATKNTVLMEEILSRTQTTTYRDFIRTELDRENTGA